MDVIFKTSALALVVCMSWTYSTQRLNDAVILYKSTTVRLTVPELGQLLVSNAVRQLLSSTQSAAGPVLIAKPSG